MNSVGFTILSCASNVSIAVLCWFRSLRSWASYELLSTCAASVLGVTSVYSDEPLVYELRFGVDFRLERIS